MYVPVWLYIIYVCNVPLYFFPKRELRDFVHISIRNGGGDWAAFLDAIRICYC